MVFHDPAVPFRVVGASDLRASKWSMGLKVASFDTEEPPSKSETE